MAQSTIQQIYNQLIAGETLLVRFDSIEDYNSMRVTLIQKFKSFAEINDALGVNPFADCYLKCSKEIQVVDEVTLEDQGIKRIEIHGTFRIVPNSEKTRSKVYDVTTL